METKDIYIVMRQYSSSAGMVVAQYNVCFNFRDVCCLSILYFNLLILL